MAKRGRKPDLKRRRLAAELRARGLTLKEIGRELGVTGEAARQLLLATGVTGRLPVNARSLRRKKA